MDVPKRHPVVNLTLKRNLLIDKRNSTKIIADPQLFKIRSSTVRGKMKPLSTSPTLLETRSQFFETLKSMPSQHRKGLFVDSPTEIFLKECEEKCLNPLPIGANSDPCHDIDISNYGMGDNYAEAFGKSLKNVHRVERLNISSNSLSPRGLKSILVNLSYHPIRELSMKDNTFDLKTLTPLLNLLNKPNPSLRHLNLENTKISDGFVRLLCDTLSADRSLVFLGLAKNSLGYLACKAVKTLLIENQYLKQLDFHWNNSKDYGALMIFEGLAKNDSLRELDLSWNSVGKNKDFESLKNISESFPAIQGLVHLDLSFNFFTPKECEILAEGLSKNTDILGIHFLGNQGNVDSQGFVTPNSEVVPSEQSHLFYRFFDNSKARPHRKYLCWICEGWKEMDFYWDPDRESKYDTKEMYIHLDCDDYKPDTLSMKNGTYQISRILPPGEVKFFFSDGRNIIESANYGKEVLDSPFTKTVEFVKNQTIQFLIKNLHKAKVVGNTFSPNLPFKTVPRKPKFLLRKNKNNFKRVKWRIEKSIFSDYTRLTEDYIDQCLEFDWQESKLNKLVKLESERKELKESIKTHYIKITEIFRYLTALSGNEYLTVGNNVLTDFLYQIKLFDPLFSLADLGVNWNAVTVHSNRQIFNPLTSLVRYEFIELLVRIAHDRYIRSKICSNLTESFQKLMAEKLGNNLELTLDNYWRNSFYLTEDVDIVYKTHRPILENLYKRFSGKKTLPGQKPFMSNEEFKDLCIQGRLLEDDKPERDLDLCFSAAMMVNIDEINQKKHVEMSFVEFLEAFARVSSFKSMNSDGISDLLPRQIEANLNVLIELCSKTLRENFTFPTYATYKAYKYKLKKGE